MQLARVIGDVVSTIKDAGLNSHKLLLLQPITPDREPAGRTLVAVDAAIVGIVDHWSAEGAATPASRA